MGGMKPTFLGAFTQEGEALWQVGEGGNQPSRPMSVAVKDWTGDGADDVICFWHKRTPTNLPSLSMFTVPGQYNPRLMD